MGYTPGPWEAIGSKIIRGKMAIAAQWIARTDLVGTRDAENEANARLIAAAPDLLEALQNTMAALGNCLLHFGIEMSREDRHGRARIIEAASTAITKAEGKAPTVNDESKAPAI